MYETLIRVEVGGKFSGALIDRMFQRRSCQGSSLPVAAQNTWGNSKFTPRPNCKCAPLGVPQVHPSLRHAFGFVLITKFCRHSSSNSPGSGGSTISANAGAKVYPPGVRMSHADTIPFPPFRGDTPPNPTEPKTHSTERTLPHPPPSTGVPVLPPGEGRGVAGRCSS